MRGRGIQVDDTLRRFGWDGTGAVATPILTINPESGVVVGARFETRGRGPQVKFRASELWNDVTEDALVTLNFPDLSRLEWRQAGDSRNQSNWLDSDDVNVVYTKANGEELTIPEEATIGRFAVRFTMLPIAVNKMILYGGIVPVSKDHLREQVEDEILTLDSPLIPTLLLKLGWARGRPVNGCPLGLIPSERQEDRVGLGVLPLIESIGSTDPKLPEH